LENLARRAEFFLTISVEVVSDAMKLLAFPADNDRLVVAGESAIAGLSGFLCVAGNSQARDTLSLTPESRVLLFGTEGDTDPAIYRDIVRYSGNHVRKLAAGFDKSR
jgi:diaminopropionate ammonia-lyase